MRGEWLLPQELRSRADTYRKVISGIDFPAQFLCDLRGIDPDFYLIWHPYQTLWDMVINEGMGTEESPRYQIHEQYSQLCFGYVMRNRTNSGPAPDNTWHLWRLARPHGWCHVMRLQDPKNADYMTLVANVLHKQKQLLDRLGPKGIVQTEAIANEQAREKAMAEKDEMYKLWQLENRWLLRKAMDNMARGVLNSPEPTRDVIMSGPGLSHRSKIVRPITEREGGIYNG